MNMRVLVLFVAVAAHAARGYEFPQDFLFGAASAAYQVEGGWNLNGKGENIWDHTTHQRPELISDGSNGDVACDSYHKYKEDVQLLKALGMNIYRFSLSWSRILPTGAVDQVNQDGIRYYHDLINELKNNSIEPMVTIYHWDLPQPLMDIGGWPNPILADYFEDYSRFLFKEFGSQVKYWATFNEPLLFCGQGWGTGEKAPAIKSDAVADYLCAHTVLQAHGRVYRLYKKEFEPTQKGLVSITLVSSFFTPKDPNDAGDVAAAERANQWNMGWFANPIFGKDGDYPLVMREMIAARSAAENLPRSRLPQFTPEEIKMLKGSADFLGLNHYTTEEVTIRPVQEMYVRSKDMDGNFSAYFNSTWTPTVSPVMWDVPWGLRGMLRWLQNEYGDISILIAENGCPDFGEIKDLKRTRYFRGYLNALLEAINIDKVKVFGYAAWSLMDNFEWFHGYKFRFGLHHVDFTDPSRPRTPKMSAKFFQELIQTRRVPESDPDFPSHGSAPTCGTAVLLLSVALAGLAVAGHRLVC